VSGAARSSGGADWLGVVEAAPGAMLGGSRTPGMVDNFADGDESTPLGDAQPFDYQSNAISDGAYNLVADDRGNMYACDIISAECKGSVLREFPSQYLNSTLNEIQGDAQGGMKDARKALKLLSDNRFKK
jgi:hypothetical protein